MTKKKTSSKKVPAPKKPSVKKSTTTTKKTNSKPKDIIKEITTVEEQKKDGNWTKVITVKYIKQLFCPAFLSNKMLMVLAAIPLGIFILLALWKLFSHE